ncbi:type II toxin-antitoxin system prevent-host-death family antitoxin [Saccharopolyspora sp. HNM0983]|uniref:Type II toxin-antitoxin system prevent-host-death family antitoxin n=1 Tax=Saccharopolyspora montiporae TaxID=2781240 RepID=A0A929FX66_9PSEU|nr:type II toxin-antitoxin system prevent-host-death family antitoxin [Saccharopolyspora sp. HNM0983]MBE9374346.1 type II toxin-antitoxin system prevent-host-death family antitoxin [Saccharopolyspora sp. HNM0983]
MAVEFTADEAAARLTELMDRVESGDEVVITRFGAPSVRLEPAGPGSGAMRAGVISAAWTAPTAVAAFDMGTDYAGPGDWADWSG